MHWFGRPFGGLHNCTSVYNPTYIEGLQLFLKKIVDGGVYLLLVSVMTNNFRLLLFALLFWVATHNFNKPVCCLYEKLSFDVDVRTNFFEVSNSTASCKIR